MVYVSPPWISDHSIVQFKTTTKKPSVARKTISYRRWKSLDVHQFRQSIDDIDIQSVNSLSDLALLYNSALRDLLEKHVTLRSKTVTLHPQAEWFDAKLLIEKRAKRKLERKFRLSNSPEDIRQFNEHSEYYSHLLVTTRQKFYTDKIEANYGDQKVLLQVLDKLLHRENQRQFPPHDNLDDLTNMFADFFVRKIDTIRSQLHLATVDNLLVFEYSCGTVEKLEYFSSVSEHQIENIIRLTNNKSCELDPIPTWLLKQCIPALLPIITKIVNLSLHDAFMPTLFKQAFLTPILKNISLSTDEENSFRPISNLYYVSKLIEKVVDTQLTNHIQEHNLDESLQSAYKKHHSTETAWVRLHNDILSELDDNKTVLLVSLDVSAAFDTIDHSILLRLLESRLGVSGQCLNWFRSYLSDRTTRVIIDGKRSDIKRVNFGVPHGSVLGPKLFFYTIHIAAGGYCTQTQCTVSYIC